MNCCCKLLQWDLRKTASQTLMQFCKMTCSMIHSEGESTSLRQGVAARIIFALFPYDSSLIMSVTLFCLEHFYLFSACTTPCYSSCLASDVQYTYRFNKSFHCSFSRLFGLISLIFMTISGINWLIVSFCFVSSF